MRFHRTASFIALALAMILGPISCGHSSSDDADVSSSSGTLTSLDKEAQRAAMAELQRHWLKGSDGWTTAIVSGSPYAPDHFLRQCRVLAIQELKPQDLSESDKLNGFEWVGQAAMKRTPPAAKREASPEWSWTACQMLS